MPKTKSRHKTKRQSSRSSLHRHQFLTLLVMFLVSVVLFCIVYNNNASTPIQPLSLETSSVTYSGVTPCADCTGIKTNLSLNYANTGSPSAYILNMQYQGKNTTLIERGTWSIESKLGKTTYTLSPTGTNSSKTMYQVLNNSQIRQLDIYGNPLPENLPFTLNKVQ